MQLCVLFPLATIVYRARARFAMQNKMNVTCQRHRMSFFPLLSGELWSIF